MTKEFEKYSVILSPATKEKSLGRPSGGIAILYKNHLQVKPVEVNNLWILTEIHLGGISLLLMVNYWRPSNDIDFCTETLNETLNEMSERYSNHKWIIGGDFNGRVGNLNQYDQETLPVNINYQRISRDSTINNRGRKLIDMVEKHDLILLNGRMTGDIPGEYTFISKTGRSTIDLVFTNNAGCNYITDMMVDNFHMPSPHLPVVLSLLGNQKHVDDYTQNPAKVHLNFLFNKTKAEMFESQLQHTHRIYCNSEEVDTLNNNLIQALREAAMECNMIYQNSTKCNKKEKRNPWFDYTCLAMKRELRKTYRAYRQTRSEQLLLNYLKTKSEYLTMIKRNKKKIPPKYS